LNRRAGFPCPFFERETMNEANQRLESAIDHFIDFSRKDDPSARASIKQWILDHVKRGAIDIRDFPVK
jgi:hypothetical protein